MISLETCVLSSSFGQAQLLIQFWFWFSHRERDFPCLCCLAIFLASNRELMHNHIFGWADDDDDVVYRFQIDISPSPKMTWKGAGWKEKHWIMYTLLRSIKVSVIIEFVSVGAYCFFPYVPSINMGWVVEVFKFLLPVKFYNLGAVQSVILRILMQWV